MISAFSSSVRVDHADGKRVEIEVERNAGVEQSRRAGAGKLDRALPVRNVDERVRDAGKRRFDRGAEARLVVLGDQQPFVRPEPQRGARAFGGRAQRLERRRRAEGGADRRADLRLRRAGSSARRTARRPP